MVLFLAAQRIYGLAHTINASIHALFLGLQKSLTLSPDGICSIAGGIISRPSVITETLTSPHDNSLNDNMVVGKFKFVV